MCTDDLRAFALRNYTEGYKINNPLFGLLVYRRIMPKAERLSEKWTVGSVSWAVRPTGSWSFCGSIISLYIVDICDQMSEVSFELRIETNLMFILLPEKFLPFDWLRGEVFQLNLKYLNAKITVTMVTPNHQIISSHELSTNGRKISRFWNQEIQELKENSENQNTEKSTSTWLNVWTSWAENKNFKTNVLAYEAKQLDENKHLALDDRISQVVV